MPAPVYWNKPMPYEKRRWKLKADVSFFEWQYSLAPSVSFYKIRDVEGNIFIKASVFHKGHENQLACVHEEGSVL